MLDPFQRGMMSFINGDGTVTINMQADLNDAPYERSPAERRAAVLQSTTQGLQGNISALALPQVRYPMKNHDQTITSVFSASEIDLQNLHFEYENFKMEKLTLVPTELKIFNFKIDIKK